MSDCFCRTLNSTPTSSQTEWNLVFALLRSTISNPEASPQSFELVMGLALRGQDQLVTADNFTGLITMLDEFAMVAGVAVESHQRQGRRREPLNASK
jgi:brefeldin A-resistance guanine nucleotide exchange factor 1